jgi:hypothetical protein
MSSSSSTAQSTQEFGGDSYVIYPRNGSVNGGSSGGLPSWVMPAALAAVAVLVVFFMSKRK